MIRLVIVLLMFVSEAFADFAQINLHKHSVSAQIGVNGEASTPSTLGLQLFPLDVSYVYKLFDNNSYSLSAATFYDNIGVEIDGITFDYRLGQRVDFGIETKDTLLYVTLGLARIFIDGVSDQISPVYGFGFAKDVSYRFAIVTEMNVQDIWKANGHCNVLNLSLGLIYSFDV